MSSARQKIIRVCLSLATVISIVVLAGWVFDIALMRTILPGRPDMKPNAAISLLLLSLAVWMAMKAHLSARFEKAAKGLAWFCLGFSVLVLCEYIFRRDLGIDHLIIRDGSGYNGHSPPGRFSPMSAVNFILLAAGLLIDGDRRSSWVKTAQAFWMFSLLISFQSFLGSAFGLSEIFGMSFFIPMAVHTAVSFLLISFALLLWRADVGLMERFSAETPTALMGRQMLLATVLVPALIRGVASFGADLGLYPEGFEVFVEAFGSSLFMSIVVIIAAGAFLQVERERERLRARESAALLEAETERDKLSSVLRQAPTHVDLFRGPDHVFDLTHPLTETLVGTHELRGRRLIDAFPNAVDNGILDAANRVFQTGVAYSGSEVVVKVRNEEARFEDRRFNVNIQPWRGPEGRIDGVLMFSIDVTEQVRARTIVQEASHAKSQFLANMSHEIRTPLGIILGFSDLALESLERPEEARGYLTSIRRNADELSKLLGEVLDLSKVEANKLDIERIRFELKPLIEGVRDLLSLKAAEKGIELRFDYEGALPETIVSDPVRVRQILVNLVGNAIKFTPRGEVRVTTSVVAHPEGSILKFAVRDSGIGITREQTERLFKPFSQADGSTTRRFGGTGLGLMLSRQLAKALGGNLELASSVPGEGSVFVATVQAGPLDTKSWTATSAAVGRKSEKTKTIDLSPLKILLVEDSVDNQILVSHYLRPTGASVSIRSNGREAVETLARENYDLVLMDIQMPIMDGFEAVRTLRGQGYARPIIALTAHAMQEERDRALASGFTDYLTKPINKDVLLTTLAQAPGPVATL